MLPYDSATSTQDPEPVVDPVDPPRLVDPPDFNPPGQDVALNDGARLVPDRVTFHTLARSDDVPGRLGAEEMKILIIGVDTDAPELYFLNTNAFAFHYDFATEVLGIEQDLGAFNSRTDPVRAQHVALAFDLVTRAMPFAAGKLSCHAAGGLRRHAGAALGRLTPTRCVVTGPI